MRGTVLAVLAVVAMAGATGWAMSVSGHSSYEQDIVSAAERAGGSHFALPGQGAGASIAWNEGVLVCPYAQIGNLPQRFIEAAEKLDVEAHEGRSWLLLADGQNVRTVSIDRLAVDMCGGLSGDLVEGSFPFTRDTRWIAEQQLAEQQARVLSPVASA
ncbi:hypothetical protein [Zhihengliuella flava]|uniref:Uncharacterized protein n=1 Tax=Zhihengliuella flava TaxID=1285193 RepID=A0A931GLT6_9MICC|nr:hypothetical protein [Zhihengliuella flava]MBG6084769.1 hypothetical protein [Zhihengliuella flava]